MRYGKQATHKPLGKLVDERFKSYAWIAVEIKRATAPALSNGLDIACPDLKMAQRYLVYRRAERFPLLFAAQALGRWH